MADTMALESPEEILETSEDFLEPGTSESNEIPADANHCIY